jgi:putative Mg2+ transporter-C (MgtC) family protein
MNPTFLETCFRLILATILCGVIGYEREYRHKPAGIRTNMLVGLGTATMTIVSIEITQFAGPSNVIDISRIASTILTGIGFIGAGTIIHSHDGVKGLTTAASIWVVAAIGLAVGMGFYLLASITTILALITLAVIRKEEKMPG